MDLRLSFLIFLGAFQPIAHAVSQGPEFVQLLSSSELTPSQNRGLNQISRLQTTEGEARLFAVQFPYEVHAKSAKQRGGSRVPRIWNAKPV
jgi:hypothetical protein